MIFSIIFVSKQSKPSLTATGTAKMSDSKKIYMTKATRFILFCLLILHTLTASPRPRVGIVLSGGGAKGMAHIGALKVIEEAGIPIDIIVGTSMGSIIGGLYSIGYTTEQLDSIVMSQDWSVLLSDKAYRKSLDFQTKEQNARYVLTVPFFEKPQDIIGGGMIKGRNIGRMLWKLTEGYHDSIDFRKLPIPFACVSQNLVTGEEVVFESGVLPIAIRASMSIPGVFAPVSMNDCVLIDGGIVNNYPVDIARRMGADIIIGVDVRDPLKTAGELQESILAQLSQLIDLQGMDKFRKNKEDSDIYIKVNVKGYNTASFTTIAIDSLIDRGEQAARMQMDTLRGIARRFSDIVRVPDTSHAVSAARMPLPSSGTEGRTKDYLRILIGNEPMNFINMGMRFDNEELAALLFNGRFMLGKKQKHRLELTARLGKQTYGDIHYRLISDRKWHLVTGYRYTYNDFNIYEKGHRNFEVSFNHHLAEIGFTKSWHNSRWQLGGSYQLYDYSSFLYRFESSGLTDIGKESFLKFGTGYAVNTTDDVYFPTKGHKLDLEYYYVIPLEHSKSFHTGKVHWSAALSFNSRFTVMPCVEGRYITAENTVAEMNTIGGQEAGKYFSQQIPFYGITYFEMARRALVIGGVEARQRIGGRHYISGSFNMAMTSDNWMRFFKNSFGHDEHAGFRIFGGAIRYDLRTFLGPIGLTVCFSDRSRVAGYFRAGFNF